MILGFAIDIYGGLGYQFFSVNMNKAIDLFAACVIQSEDYVFIDLNSPHRRVGIVDVEIKE